MASASTAILVLCTSVLGLMLNGGGAQGGSPEADRIDLNSPKTALLIIDIQNDYFPDGKFQLKDSEKAGLKALMVLEIFRDEELPVIHIQHESEEIGFFAPGTEGQKIHECVSPVKGEQVFTKHQASSFAETPLKEHLEESGVKRLIIVGMQTNVCVMGTVNDAVDFGYEVIVLEDATAAENATNWEGGLELMEEHGAHLMTVSDFMEAVLE